MAPLLINRLTNNTSGSEAISAAGGGAAGVARRVDKP
jgi:hypothetical protein